MKTNSMLILVLALVLGAASDGRSQLQPVDQRAVCLECHSEMEDTFAAAHVHTAFADGQCSGCHNPHASRHQALLSANPRELCTSCHEDTAAEVGRPVSHPPAFNGDCVLCHEPHASAYANQLLKSVVTLCMDCHTDTEVWRTRATVHEPVGDGECLTCHAAHGADADGLLTAAIPSLCLQCHDTDAGFVSAHAGRDISESDCTACHDPHASNEKGLLRANQHAPFASNQCSKCHTNLDSDGSFAIAGSSFDPGGGLIASFKTPVPMGVGSSFSRWPGPAPTRKS